MASVGQVTGTQVHSGPKHILQCQVSEDVLRALADGEEHRDRIQRDKMLYCMHKHELALCCNVPYNTENNMLFRLRKSAYPSVVTTLGFIAPKTRDLIRMVYNAPTDGDFEAIRDAIMTHARSHPAFDFSIPSFVFQGVVQTQAWATSNFGDTIGSVLVAGFATIMNGHFHAYTGDLVHWYFDFEANMFKEDGTRRTEGNFGVDAGTSLQKVEGIEDGMWNYNEQTPAMGDVAGERKDFHEMREHGKYPDMFKEYNSKQRKYGYKQNVVYPKTYHYVDCGYGDRIRVFGRVVNGGRPFEPIDVLLFSQCR
eukprot:768373-Hanusia_phi.AAC.15